MISDEDRRSLLKHKTIPILVLDQKWHRLFAVNGKTEIISALEKEIDELLSRQAHVNDELKELKKLKATLMDNIVSNMKGADENIHPIYQKKIDKDKQLISEINEKIDHYEDELLDIPAKIKQKNETLMIESMEYCYNILRENSQNITEIASWITQVRIDLKKKIIKKQNCEINNKEIYSYMHDILGAQIIDIFDLENDDIVLGVSEETKLSDKNKHKEMG